FITPIRSSNQIKARYQCLSANQNRKFNQLNEPCFLVPPLRFIQAKRTKITLVGLGANVGLTVVKGIAGKYEAVGSLAVSSLLVVGAIGIGHHSYELLMSAIPPNSPFNITEISLTTQIDRPHLNPNAAWFAAASVAVKEALFRS
ncbi:13248_t:CDS:2, partial [Racocetra fulgida]